MLGARFLRKQAKRLASQLEPVCRADHVEAVHQARVASRRLRAALEMFGECFPIESTDRWKKEIKRVTRRLGPARDRDVNILFLAEHLANLTDPAHTRGIAAMLGRLERDRARSQPKAVKAVEQLWRSGVLDEMLDAAQAICDRGKAKSVAVRSPVAVKRAEEFLAGRLDAVHAHADGLADPTNVDEHHAMRIAAKKLRYTMEMVSPVFGSALDSPLLAAKELQTLLGEVHDCDVWDEHVDEFEQKLRRRTLKYFGTDKPFAPLEAGLEHLRSLFRERRKDLFAQLCAFWAAHPLREVESLCGVDSLALTDSTTRCQDGIPVCRESR